jgi:ribosomal protein S18 acetylase RimI-like enzyme
MIKIRPVTPSEWPHLQDLNNEVFIDNAQYDPDIIVDWALSEKGKKYFQEVSFDSTYICLVAENEDGKLVGYIAGAPKDYSYRKSKYIELGDMGVIPEYRSQGIGANLVQEFLKSAREKGYQKAVVSSYSGNEKGVRFYKKCGFEPIDISLERSL